MRLLQSAAVRCIARTAHHRAAPACQHVQPKVAMTTMLLKYRTKQLASLLCIFSLHSTGMQQSMRTNFNHQRFQRRRIVVKSPVCLMRQHHFQCALIVNHQTMRLTRCRVAQIRVVMQISETVRPHGWIATQFHGLQHCRITWSQRWPYFPKPLKMLCQSHVCLPASRTWKQKFPEIGGTRNFAGVLASSLREASVQMVIHAGIAISLTVSFLTWTNEGGLSGSP